MNKMDEDGVDGASVTTAHTLISNILNVRQ